jgi:anti-sigma B factor antagonist
MPIQQNISGDSCEFIVAGRVDGAVANELEVQVLGALRTGSNSIYVNLAQATFLCSAAIRVLLQHHRQARNKGKIFLVTRPSAEATAALEMTGFTGLIEA